MKIKSTINKTVEDYLILNKSTEIKDLAKIIGYELELDEYFLNEKDLVNTINYTDKTVKIYLNKNSISILSKNVILYDSESFQPYNVDLLTRIKFEGEISEINEIKYRVQFNINKSSIEKGENLVYPHLLNVGVIRKHIVDKGNKISGEYSVYKRIGKSENVI